MVKRSLKKVKRCAISPFASHEKNRDNLKLLFTDKKFQQRMKEIRQHLLLPPNGFDKETKDRDERCREWFEEMHTRTDKMMFEPVFIAELRKYKEMFDKREINPREYARLRFKLHDPIPVNYLNRQPKYIANEFNVPLNYQDSIRHYILFNELDRLPLTPFTEMRGTAEDWKERSISLTFYSTVTDKDWKLIKQSINGAFFGKFLPDFNPLQDIDTKLEIEKYYRGRDVFDEVDQKHYRMNAKEIAENIEADTGKKIKPDDVYEIIRELNKLREKRFGKK